MTEKLTERDYEVLDACCELLSIKIEELKAENERLKEANQSLSMLGTDLASANETVRKEFFRADKNKDMWREKAEKLQLTLQEIKEYAESIGNEEMINGYAIRAKSALWRIANKITKAEEE